MALPIGAKAWRVRFDATDKLGCNINLAGDEARSIVEFMEAEELANPAAAVRVLLAAALSTYPEWGANVSARRTAVIEVRMWAVQRAAAALRELADELEVTIAEDYAKVEAEVMERAIKASQGEDT